MIEHPLPFLILGTVLTVLLFMGYMLVKRTQEPQPIEMPVVVSNRVSDIVELAFMMENATTIADMVRCKSEFIKFISKYGNTEEGQDECDEIHEKYKARLNEINSTMAYVNENGEIEYYNGHVGTK